MSFKDIGLIDFEINTTNKNPIKSFFNPVLKAAATYDVAVGYFTSNWIRDAAEGIANLAVNGGVSRWIISPNLSSSDYELLKNTSNMETIFSKYVKKDIDLLVSMLNKQLKETMAWLIHDKILQFKIAIPKNDLKGLFHAKFGCFTDFDGNSITFSGSYNMTRGANTNWEHIDIFCSWRDNIERINSKQENFNKLWNGLDSNLDVYSPNNAIIHSLINIVSCSSRPYKLKHNKIKIPNMYLDDNNLLRPHQELAIKNWFTLGNGRGIFNMATGSGKTVTAISCIIKLIEKAKVKKNIDLELGIVIVVPYTHLAVQWGENIKEFGFSPVFCFNSKAKWENTALKRVNDFNLNNKGFIFIVVQDTYIGNAFQSLIDIINDNKPLFFIADEAHNLGSKKLRLMLSNKFQYRLGLSATPRRFMDEEGTDAIYDYLGDEVIEYTIKDAIDDGTLCQYYYYPQLVTLTEDESDLYYELSIKINKLFAQNGKLTADNEGSSYLENLLIERSRILSSAFNKIIRLKSLLKENKNSKFNLVYCGDSKYNDIRQIDEVVRYCGKDLSMKIGKFTAEVNNNDRSNILEKFSSGELQTIAAIRCLDEGIDVPETQNAYIISSSRNPRQFIQRRGRVLRKSPGKEFAYIYDFVVIPDLERIKNRNEQIFNIERSQLKKELTRINEFAQSSVNWGETLNLFRNIKKKFKLLDI